MNIPQLRAFVSVVEHGSFSGAARVTGVSQPAVTMQVQGLEADLGAALLERRYRRVELTEAGRLLLPHARKVLDEIEAAREAIVDLAGTVSGHLVIAASTTPGQYVLPKLLGAFLRDHPDVSVELRVMDTAAVVRAVEEGEAQLGMVGARMPGERVAYEERGSDDLVLICPPGDELATTEGVKLSALAEEPFVVREQGSGTRIASEDALRRAGLDPGELRVVAELGTGEAIVSAVEGGLGLAVVSSWVASKAIELGSVALVSEGHFPVVRPLWTVVPRTTPTRAAEAFLDHLRDTL
ncbi:MAG: selenium metabolism-associated LysR family transcriptional regulator [Coriobacteriia bacterium]